MRLSHIRSSTVNRIERRRSVRFSLFVTMSFGCCCAIASAQAPPASTSSQTVARCGQGWLETIDGYPVLHLKGTPYEMGYQHGALARELVRENRHNILDLQGTA